MGDRGHSRGLRGACAACALAVPLVAVGCSGAPHAGKPSAPSASASAPSRLATDALFARDVARLAGLSGVGAPSLLVADAVAEGERVEGFVELAADACTLVLGRGSDGIGDIDLFAFADDGGLLASDESPTPAPALLLCPPHPRRAYVTARVVSGVGVAAIATARVSPTVAEPVASRMGVRGRPGEDTGRLDAWPGLEALVRSHRASLGGQWEDVRRVPLPVSYRAATRVAVAIEKNRCVDVLVTPSDELPGVEVVAEDRHGRVVARGRDRTRERTFVLCAGEPTEVTLAVRARGALGVAALVVGRSNEGAARELAQTVRVERVSSQGDVAEARAALERTLSARGYAPGRSLGGGQAKSGHRAVVSTKLTQGCHRIDVVGGQPSGDLLVEVWDDKASLLGEGRGARATAFVCTSGTSSVRVEVEALGKAGPFGVELRAERSPPKTFLQSPLAAARLLDRLDALGEDATGRASAARSLDLEPTTRKTVPVTVQAKGCTLVAAALEAGATGLELVASDGSADAQVARGRFVTSLLLCASDAPKTFQVELRTLAGKAAALVVP
jgi:hypothetical protein